MSNNLDDKSQGSTTNEILVFTYGTLMEGECNHGFLANAKLKSRGSIEGYKMYNVGLYPAIVEGDGCVLGEVYVITKDILKALDNLEGEGSLYVRKVLPVQLADGEVVNAFVYVYLRSIEGLKLCGKAIYCWNPKYVWYVGYGSNLLKERFMLYITGGEIEKLGIHNDGCPDNSDPLDDIPYEIPYNMYYAECSSKWQYGGVSFLDTSKKGFSYGRAYLITYEQFLCVRRQEGTGWYNDNEILLGHQKGYLVYTISNKNNLERKQPGKKYLGVLKAGLKETYGLSDEIIEEYFHKCEKQ